MINDYYQHLGDNASSDKVIDIRVAETIENYTKPYFSEAKFLKKMLNSQ